MQRILVIDDEAVFREATTFALQRKGFETLEAADGVEGAEIALRALPDLIICDVNMERMDGYAISNSSGSSLRRRRSRSS